MNTRFSLNDISPVRMTVAGLAAAAIWLFAPELAQAAVTFGDIGQNVADSAKGVAKGITVGGFAAGAGMGAGPPQTADREPVGRHPPPLVQQG